MSLCLCVQNQFRYQTEKPLSTLLIGKGLIEINREDGLLLSFDKELPAILDIDAATKRLGIVHPLTADGKNAVIGRMYPQNRFLNAIGGCDYLCGGTIAFHVVTVVHKVDSIIDFGAAIVF